MTVLWFAAFGSIAGAQVRGSVRLNSTPIQDVLVKVEAPGGVETIVTRTDESGAFSLPQVKYDKVLLTVERDGEMLYRAIVPTGVDNKIVLNSAKRIFSIPKQDLERWSKAVTVPVNATIHGRSAVHSLENDCEMHLGASVSGYTGEPNGWVLEPMNVCREAVPGNAGSSWTAFGSSLIGKSIQAEGVPRIWPEALTGPGSLSNPNHAVELHPLTKVSVDNRVVDLAKLVYAPAGFEGGVNETTAAQILQDTRVAVSQNNGGAVTVDFDSGRIGNFATLQIKILGAIATLPGGHRMSGSALVGRTAIPVSLVTIAGSPADGMIAKITQPFRALVLFSLSPEALLEAANHGSTTEKVNRPVQLIVYGAAAK